MPFMRYAIYYLPPQGPLAKFGAAWLGWDVATGCAVPQPDLPGIAEITETPRKYGFHATLKPPFSLSAHCDEAMLKAAVTALSQSCAPADCAGLTLSRLGRFLALVPQRDCTGLSRVAAACVQQLDAFRAPMQPEERARRRHPGLSARQETLLEAWGYPYVLDAFRFHMTLTGRLPKSAIAPWQAAIAAHLPRLESRFVLEEIALVGERADGRFELIQRSPLAG